MKMSVKFFKSLIGTHNKGCITIKETCTTEPEQELRGLTAAERVQSSLLVF